MANIDIAGFVKNLFTLFTDPSNNGKIPKINTTTGSIDLLDPATLVSSGGNGGSSGPTHYAHLSANNLSATVSNTAMNTALAALAGKTIVIDKMYTITGGSVTVPANTVLIGENITHGFKLSGTAGTLVSVGSGSRLSNMTFDGNKSAVTGSYGFGNALTRASTNATAPIYIHGCVYLNAGAMAIYGNTIMGGIYATNNVFNGVNQNIIMTQRSQNIFFEFNRIINSTGTIQFHGHDSQDNTTISKNFRCINNVLDMSNVTLAANDTILFIETWGNVEDAVIMGNRLLAPNVDNNNSVFGISIDHSRYVTVASNYIHGGTSKMLGFGLEAAGALDTTYRDNTVIGFKGLGISVSRADTRNVKFVNNLIQDCKDTNANSACQIIDAVKDVLFHGNTFRDFGAVGIRFNSAGAGSQVVNNRFYILQQSYGGTCLFIQGAGRLVVRDNVAGPETQVGVTNGAGYIKRFVDTDGATYSLFSGNNIDCKIANGTTAGASSFGILCYTATGNNIIENNYVQNVGIGIQTETGSANGNLISRNRGGPNVTTLVNSRNTSDKVVAFLA